MKYLAWFYRVPETAIGRILDQQSVWLTVGLFLGAAVLVHLGLNKHLLHHQLVINPEYQTMLEEWHRLAESEGVDPETLDASLLPLSPYRADPLPLIGDKGWWLLDFRLGATLAKVITVPFCLVPILMFLCWIASRSGRAETLSFMPTAMCASSAWIAAHVPLALIGLAAYALPMSETIAVAAVVIAKALFGWFLLPVVRVLAKTTQVVAGVIVVASLASVGPASFMAENVFFLFSPMVFILFFVYLGGGLSEAKRGFENAQSLKKYLEAATVNPADADAQLQLGLIYHSRQQWEEAESRYRKALDIDSREIDALLHLGRLRSERGDHAEAISLLAQVVEQNPRHSQWEGLRDLGHNHFLAGDLDAAEDHLSRFVGQREFDPQGLIYLAEVKQARGLSEEAKELVANALEAVRTSPSYRKSELQRWERLAKQKAAEWSRS